MSDTGRGYGGVLGGHSPGCVGGWGLGGSRLFSSGSNFSLEELFEVQSALAHRLMGMVWVIHNM